MQFTIHRFTQIEIIFCVIIKNISIALAKNYLTIWSFKKEFENNINSN